MRWKMGRGWATVNAVGVQVRSIMIWVKATSIEEDGLETSNLCMCALLITSKN